MGAATNDDQPCELVRLAPTPGLLPEPVQTALKAVCVPPVRARRGDVLALEWPVSMIPEAGSFWLSLHPVASALVADGRKHAHAQPFAEITGPRGSLAMAVLELQGCGIDWKVAIATIQTYHGADNLPTSGSLWLSPSGAVMTLVKERRVPRDPGTFSIEPMFRDLPPAFLVNGHFKSNHARIASMSHMEVLHAHLLSIRPGVRFPAPAELGKNAQFEG